MNKILFFLFLFFAFTFNLQAALDPVPAQIPEEELTPDSIEESEIPQVEKKAEPEVHSVLKTDSMPSEEGENSVPPAAQQPVSEEIPAPAPRDVSEEIPPLESGSQPFRSSSGLIPFNPADSLHEIPASVPGYAVTDSSGLLSSVFQKHQFPYAFIHVEVLSASAESQPVNEQFIQLKLPLMISFETESFAAFQAELETVLEMISSTFQQELSQLRPIQARKRLREGVTLNVPDGTGNYKAYELPKECRKVLAQYAALLPVGNVTFYDEKENGLQNWFFPLLYRDIVKAFPINLLEVYHGDCQTIRILEHQNEPFMEFIQTQGASFVIPEHFPVILAHSASDDFLEKQAKIYYLEPVFRRPDLLPEIPVMLEMRIPVARFRNIRFINCEIMTGQPGKTVVKPTDGFVIQEGEWSILTDADLESAEPKEVVKPEEIPSAEPEEEVSEEMPFVLEEAPAR